MAVIKIDQEPRGVINHADAIAYCGGNSELLDCLIINHGLVPVYSNRTRKLYRVASIDSALLELELIEINKRQNDRN